MPKPPLVVIPTYNEIENIELMVRHVMGLPGGYELLIIDDGSPDGTADAVRTLQHTFPGRLHLEERRGKLGLGTAYVHGFTWAMDRDYTYVFEMDCDFSHNPDDLPRLLEAVEEGGADLAIGSRYINGVNVVNWPMSRVLLSYFASMYVRTITGMTIRDATAGFKCYRVSALRVILSKPIRFVGYAFQIEMKYRAWKYGFGIQEVPIIFTDRVRGTSKISGSIIKEAVWGVIALKVRGWFQNWDPKAALKAPQAA